MARPKIAIATFQHETNTFAPFVTGWGAIYDTGVMAGFFALAIRY